MSQARVLRQLPYLLRKAADPGTAVHALALGLGTTVDALVSDTLSVAASRTLGGVANRAEARLMAALLRLSPWPDEELRAFRTRIRTMANVYRQGVADAERLLRLLGMCADATPTLVLRPLAAPAGGLHSSRWTTVARLHGRTADASVPPDFHAVVEDLPVCEEKLTIQPAAGTAFAWSVTSGVVGTPAMSTAAGEVAATGIMPAFVITAGSQALAGPMLVQRDLRRAVLINRVVPAGASIAIDFDSRMVSGPSGAAVALFEGSAPDLLFGMAGSWAGKNPWDSPAACAGSELDRLLRLYRQDALVTAGVAADGRVAGETLADSLPWPPLVTPGTSHWALLCTTQGASALPWQRLRFAPAAAVTGRQLEMSWHGRRPASFTVRFSPARCSAAGTAEDPVRRAWLDEQVRRLKLAGILYVRQEDTWEPEKALAQAQDAVTPAQPPADQTTTPAEPPANGGTTTPTQPPADDGESSDVDDDATPEQPPADDGESPDVDGDATPDSGSTDEGTVPDAKPPTVDDTPAPPAVPGGLVHRTLMGACLLEGLEPLAMSDHLTWAVHRKGD